MTKTVISQRYRSVFVASIASMSISYILILTDNIVAGQFIGDDAVAAMTLVAPIMTFMFFISYMVADGLAMMFSYAKGKNNQEKANELFSLGVICSIVSGVLITAVLIAFQNQILSMWDISDMLMSYAVEYYHGLMFIPLPCLLNIYFYTIYVAEGEENICVKASIAMFVVNMVLDILLGYYFGVIGIGIATTIGNLVSFLFHIPYLFSDNCQLKFIKYWNFSELGQGLFYSWYHSMDTLFLALLPMVFSEFVIFNFGEGHLIIVTVIINMITLLMAIYTGIVDCLQPMICQYHAENAIHSVKKTMSLGIKSTIAVTVAIILFGFVFAEFLPKLFGVNPADEIYSEAVWAIRIFMPFTVFLGVTLMYSNYYIYVERLNLGAVIKTLLLLIMPCAGILLGLFGIWFMWLGVGLSFIVSLVINYLLTRNKFGLLLIDKSRFKKQFSLDIEPKADNLNTLLIKAEKFSSSMQFDEVRKNNLIHCVEEIFKLYAARAVTEDFQLEVTLIPDKDVTTIIFRENAKPENPSEKLSRFFDGVREKNYMISGDENKFVVVV
ncbi:MAG: hypothetical protein K6G55_04995 [Selenomonadaceae bacterium]|nr:hypothetical protein [Selenomonadaceae bacterium]